ncbi:solute carrier family 35 member C2 [Anopheles gambiae]|uniref:solute carrier family 35 member C2 n=1 Tax=Anopheles gambiae TaxID=7165 RepID=UPI002AC93472|nr:solute carrier family 35 member C2 [Anopheles gambiae]XP_061508427.1 solute carrier family 35 member C2 [Anopheles gambiae]
MVNIKYERVKQTTDQEGAGGGLEEEIELETNRRSDHGQYHQSNNSLHASYGHHNQYIVTTTAGGSKSYADGGGGDTRKKHAFTNRIVVTLVLIVCYFSLSIGLTFYQRHLLQHFKLPLFVVLYHLVIKLLLAAAVRAVLRCVTRKPRILLDWRTSVRKILPTGLASGIDISFSNWGLELVKISLYTMTKSTTIVFILIFAILLKLEKKSWSLGAIVVMISGGLFMFTYKSTQFDALGFSFLLFASLSSGIRWTFAQLIMQKSKLGLHNPIDMIFHMQPWMILSVLPFTIGFEGRKLLEGYDLVQQLPSAVVVDMWAKISIGAFIAFAMEVSEFMVLTNTSSLTLSVAGIFKEICQLILAVELNDEHLSTVNVLGLVMCLGGICCHVVHKFLTYRDETTKSALSSLDKSTGGYLEDHDDEDDDMRPSAGGLVGKNGSLKFGNGGTGGSVGGGGGGGGSAAGVRFKGGQYRPLLVNEARDADDSDHLVVENRNYLSDDSEQEENGTQDVLFDILKRRER